MIFDELLAAVIDEPLFETGFLLAGDLDPTDVRRQLSRWVKSKRIIQLRRGLYALAPPYRKAQPHPFLIANRLVPGSYVSLQSALAYYGLIPEYVPLTTSVTTGRPGRWDTPLGSFDFRHLSRRLFAKYRVVDLGTKQDAFIASPEKALADLIHLTPSADQIEYLESLRLQNLDTLDVEGMLESDVVERQPKLKRAFRRLKDLVNGEQEGREL
jgi:hypothetical protein